MSVERVNKPKLGSKQELSERITEAQKRLEGTKECAKVIGRWMVRYAALPGEFGDAAIENFYAVLGGCTNAEALERAFIFAQERSGDPQTGRCFRPIPGEVKRAYIEELAKLPEGPRTHNTCEICRGTGWKVVPRPDGQGNYAQRCDRKLSA